MSVGAQRIPGARAEVEGVSVPLDHYIDGGRVASAERFEVRSPIDWDNWKLADVAAGGAREVDLAVAAARRAFPAWAALGPHGRHRVLTRLADAIDAAVPDLAQVECVDNGSLYEAMHLRVLPRAANNIRFFADYARDRLAEPERMLHGGERNRVRYDPCGVVAVSTPWNAPFMLATWRVGPALAAGNTVVLKPPEWAPLTCSLLGDLADEAGVPAGRPQHRPRHRRRRRRAADRPPRRRPRRVHRLARHRAHGLRRRRGQPDAGVVRARRQVAVHRLRRTPISTPPPRPPPTSTTTPGRCALPARDCSSRTRSSTQFLERFEARVAEIRVGDPRDPATTYGPLIHPVALERVTGHVERALAAGARLAFGGESLGGLYYAPTLFVDVPADAEILQREVFGPVLTLQTFADEDAGDPAGQRHRLRTGGDRLHRLGEPRRPRQRRGRRRHRVGQLLLRPRPGDAVRRRPGLRHRPRGRPPLVRLLLRRQDGVRADVVV